MMLHLNKQRLVVLLAASLGTQVAMAAAPVGNASAWDMIASGGADLGVHLSYVTVADNHASSNEAAAIDGARFQGAVISNSIIAGNSGVGHARDCRVDNGSTVLGLGYVVVGNSAAECAIAGDTTGNLYDTDARLGPLETFAGGMCYSAQIEADYRKYVARYGADIDLARSCRSRCAALVFLRLVATPVE